MKLKRILAIAMVSVLSISLLAACGNSGGEEEQQAPASSAAAEDASTPADETAPADSGFTRFDSLQNIDMWGMSFFGDGGVAEVVQAINDIAGEAINVNVTWHPCDIATYMQQIPLMMTDQKGADLILCTAIPVCSFSTFTSQNQLMDITDYLSTYAPKTLEMMSDYIGSTSVNGRIYAVPCYRMYNGSYWLIIRKDVTDALGLTEKAQAISSWSEYEALMKEVKERQGELDESLKTPWMIAANTAEGDIISAVGTIYTGDSFATDCAMFDSLQDNSKLIYVDEATNTVGCYIETEAYRYPCEIAYKWMQEGLVHPDSQTLTDGGDTLCATGSIFSYHVKCEASVVADKTAGTGHPIIAVEVVADQVKSYDASTWAWAVPSNSQNPDAAVAFMELLFTNADIENLFVYGIEGRDYEVVDGEAHLLETKEYQCSDFFFGNQFAAYPGEGSGADFRTVAEADLKATEISPYFGLVIDTSPIANELTAVQAVKDQYSPALVSGTVSPDDPAKGIDAFVAALKAAGMDKVIAEYQAQLDAFLAAQ